MERTSPTCATQSRGSGNGLIRANLCLLIALVIAPVALYGGLMLANCLEHAHHNGLAAVPGCIALIAFFVLLVMPIVGIPVSLAGLVFSRGKLLAIAVAGMNCIASLAIVYGMFFQSSTPYADFTDEPLSLSEFHKRYGDARFPSSATNILFAVSSVGLGGRARLYRFDAPAADCIAYGKRLLQESNKNLIRGHDPVGPDLVPLASSPPPIRKEMLEFFGLTKVDWFDVETIRSGFEGRGPPSGLAHFWIDTDRGRFYYYWTD